MNTKHPIRPVRLGLNSLELTGCLVAVAGGMWIGAQYLDLDLGQAAYVALDETELLEQVPPEWRPINPDCPDGDCPEPEELLAEERTRLQDELRSLRGEVDWLTENQPPLPGAEPEGKTLKSAELQVRERTIGYWNSLASILGEVADIQRQLDSLSAEADRARAMTVRHRSLAFGAEAIEALDPEGVDTKALDVGVRITEWLRQGIDVVHRASIQKDPVPVAGRAVTAERFVLKGEKEYAKRTEFIRRKVADAIGYLEGRYLIGFPPLEL